MFLFFFFYVHTCRQVYTVEPNALIPTYAKTLERWFDPNRDCYQNILHFTEYLLYRRHLHFSRKYILFEGCFTLSKARQLDYHLNLLQNARKKKFFFANSKKRLRAHPPTADPLQLGLLVLSSQVFSAVGAKREKKKKKSSLLRASTHSGHHAEHLAQNWL